MNSCKLRTLLEAGAITLLLLFSFKQLDQAATFASKTTTSQFKKSVTEGSMLFVDANLATNNGIENSQQNFLMKLLPSTDSVKPKLTSDPSCQNY